MGKKGFPVWKGWKERRISTEKLETPGEKCNTCWKCRSGSGGRAGKFTAVETGALLKVEKIQGAPVSPLQEEGEKAASLKKGSFARCRNCIIFAASVALLSCRSAVLSVCRPLSPAVTRCHPPSSGCFVRPVNAPDQLRRGLYLAVPWRRVHFLGGGAAPGGGGSL